MADELGEAFVDVQIALVGGANDGQGDGGGFKRLVETLLGIAQGGLDGRALVVFFLKFLIGLDEFLGAALDHVIQIGYLTAMLAFWVLEISSFTFILLAFERLASGQMFPLDIQPHGLAQMLMWTPFPYGVFFPVSIYMGKVTGAALAQGLFIQIIWVAATYALARMVWQRGLKTYTVVGG